MFSKSCDLIIFNPEAQKVRILLKMTLGRAQHVAEIAFRKSPRASGAQGGRKVGAKSAKESFVNDFCFHVGSHLGA